MLKVGNVIIMEDKLIDIIDKLTIDTPLSNKDIDSIIKKLEYKKASPITKIVMRPGSNGLVNAFTAGGLEICISHSNITDRELDDRIILDCGSNNALSQCDLDYLMLIIRRLLEKGYRLKATGVIYSPHMVFYKESCCELD